MLREIRQSPLQLSSHSNDLGSKLMPCGWRQFQGSFRLPWPNLNTGIRSSNRNFTRMWSPLQPFWGLKSDPNILISTLLFSVLRDFILL
jgi:hypothetical protein